MPDALPITHDHIRFIMPYPIGGSIDIAGRMVAQRLADNLGQAVVVDNRTGAGGIVGTETGARAAPDGYTLLMGGTGTLALTVAGTSGGIPYFSSASTWATSAALAANAIVIGGGAGVASFGKEMVPRIDRRALMKRRSVVVYINNALAEPVKFARAISTDSPAATNKAFALVYSHKGFAEIQKNFFIPYGKIDTMNIILESTSSTLHNIVITDDKKRKEKIRDKKDISYLKRSINNILNHIS